MIELDEFELPAKDYFRVIFWTHFVSFFWNWAYLTVVLCAVKNASSDFSESERNLALYLLQVFFDTTNLSTDWVRLQIC